MWQPGTVDHTPTPTAELTVEELARQFELPVSTLRMYQHRGLLPPPERRGRVGFYGDDHVTRLRMLTTLQQRGFSLASIKQLLDGWEQGQTLDGVLGLGAEDSIWAREEPTVVSPEELAARFPAAALTPELVQQAIGMGLVALRPDGAIEIVSPRFLEIGSNLVGLGVPAHEVLAEFAVLQETMAGVADRFTDLFRRHIWAELAASPQPGAALPAAAVDDVRGALERLGPLARAVVDTTLRRSLQDAAQAFVEEEASALAGGAASDGIVGAPRRKGAGKSAAAPRTKASGAARQASGAPMKSAGTAKKTTGAPKRTGPPARTGSGNAAKRGPAGPLR